MVKSGSDLKTDIKKKTHIRNRSSGDHGFIKTVFGNVADKNNK